MFQIFLKEKKSKQKQAKEKKLSNKVERAKNS